VASRDHGDPGDVPSVPPPLTAIANSVRPSAAEEARTIAASTNTGTLATLTADGDPWASFVTYGLLGSAPVLCVSNLAEHGRNLAADPRASIAIVAPQRDTDPLASGRVTLAGASRNPPATNARGPAMRTCPPSPRRSTTSTTPTSRSGCCGCGGCAGSAGTGGWTRRPAGYAAADRTRSRRDPDRAIAHLNGDHADALVAMAQALADIPTPPRPPAPAPTGTDSI
jgi:hypothetical protein